MQLTGSNYSKLDNYGKTLRFCSQKCLEQLATTVPLEIAVHQTSPLQEDNEKFVALKISGTGQVSNSELMYRVNLIVYIGATLSCGDSVTNLRAFAFFQCRSFHLHTIFPLCIGELDSENTISLLHAASPSQNVQDSFNILLQQSLSQLSLKDLSLKNLYSLLMIRSQTSTDGVVCSLDTVVAVKLPFPMLKVSVIYADSLLKEATDLGQLNKGREYGDREKVSGFLTLEKTEDGLSQLLKVLPVNYIVSTNFSTSVSLMNFIETYKIQACHLPMKLLENLCLMHFREANDVLGLPLRERNDKNEISYLKLLGHLTKAKMYIKYLPALGIKNVGDNVGNKMQTFTSTLSQLYELLYCGEYYAIISFRAIVTISSSSMQASMVDCLQQHLSVFSQA